MGKFCGGVVGSIWASGGAGSASSSRWCGSAGWFMRRAWLVRSAMVSVAAQKSGGELVQPMGRARGKAIRGEARLAWECHS